MRDLGTVRPGSTLYIPFNTFDSNDPSASVTISGLATTDIEIYKNGGTTQRASDSGYTLLDTDGIDFDGVTGVHGISVDLADNATAGFYAAGAQYWIVVSSITVDAATVNFVAATFTIGYPDALLNTTVSGTPSSQTLFVLANGSPTNGAYVGCPVIMHDVESDTEIEIGVCNGYTGSTKTLSLASDIGIFTLADTDNISIMMPSNLRWAGMTLWASGSITAGTIAADAIGASELAADAATEIAAAVWDKTQSSHTTGGSFGELATEIRQILADTNELQTDDVPGLIAALDAVVDTVKAETALIVADTNELQTDDVPGLIAALDAVVDTVKAETALIVADTNELQTDDVPGLIAALDTVVDGVKAITDQMVFTKASELDVNVQSINGAGVTGDGNATPWDGE